MKMFSGRSTSAHVPLFLCLITSLALGLSAKPASAVTTYADSIADWSTTPIQGENGWFNGFYNLTTDADSTYSIGEFQPFDPGTHWRGSGYRVAPSGAPWTNLNQESSHPNGTNSAPNEEHWVIRRWISDVNADASLFNNMRAQNTNGPGTTSILFVNGAEVNRLSNSTGTPESVRTFMPISIGDVIDLALSPEDPSGDRSDGSDGTFFSLMVDDSVPPPPPIPPLADSFDDWSSTGTQGDNSWFNGYYNQTTDGDSTYSVGDFQPFLNDGSGVKSATNHWDGSKFDFPANPPWTELGQEATHPNGDNNAEVQWTMRRYIAGVSETTPLALEWHVRKTNTGGGNGVTGRLFINGVEADSDTIAGNDGTGVTRTFYANVNPGDVIDLALSPEGLDGGNSDGADGSASRLTIRDNLPAGPLFNPSTPGVKIADSVADFTTTGTQGENNWIYGYYDQRDDVVNGDGTYGVTDLTPFLNDGSGVISADPIVGGWKTSDNHWNGGSYDLLANGAPVSHGPWTELSNVGGHPAANGQTDGEVHWFVRRWLNTTVSGDVEISVEELLNGGGGDGTVGRIFHFDGTSVTEIWNALTDGNEVTDVLTVNMSPGDFLDFAVDPDGAGLFDGSPASLDLISDGSDSTTFRVTISTPSTLHPFVPVPEPATGLLAIIAMGLFAGIRRRQVR